MSFLVTEQVSSSIYTETKKGGSYSDVLPLKTARLDSVSNLTSFGGFKSELQTNPMPFHLESLSGATLMSQRVCDGLRQNKIVKVGKNSGPVSSRLWTKVHEILRQRRRPFVLSKPLPDCLCYVSFSRYSTLSLEVVEKPNKCKSVLAPNFFREQTAESHSLLSRLLRA